MAETKTKVRSSSVAKASAKPAAKPVAKTATKPTAQSSGGSEMNNEVICAVLSYFLIGIIWYFADENMKKSSLAKFHAKQGLIMLILSVIIWIAMAILMMIPIFNIFIGLIVFPIVYLAFFVLWIFGVVYAATSKEKPVPIVGSFADKLNF